MSGPQKPGLRVLVVDDERFFREAIREILSEAGFECIEVGDGEQALSLALDEAIGVVVLDIRLPGIDGIEVLRRIRDLRPALRVIMLSASTDQEQVLEALRLGACDYLAKPLHDEELVLAVRRAGESFGVAHEWGRLRGRLDRLVSGMESLARQAGQLEGEERDAWVREGAARTAADVLEAAKTSLMILNEEQSELRVAATVGRELDPDEMDPVRSGEGVAGRALETGQPVWVADVDRDGRFVSPDTLDRYSSESFAVAPLIAGDHRIGVLCATDRADGAPFGEEDVALLRLLAMQIAELMAVGRRDPEPVTDPETTQVEAGSIPELLVDDRPDPDLDAELARGICDGVVSEVEPTRVIQAALAPIGKGLPASPVSIYLLDGASGELRLEGEWEGGLRRDRASLAGDRGLTGTVLQTGHLAASDAPTLDARFDADVDTPEDGRAGPMLCVPLRLRGKVVGLARAFPEHGDRAAPRTGEVLAAALSAAVRNVLLYRSLVDSIEEVAQARRDALPQGS